MATNQIKARIIHKHDIETNWELATNFIPKQGEIIVYDKDSTHDYERFKIGDGEKKVTALPFSDENLKNYIVNEVDSIQNNLISLENEKQDKEEYLGPVIKEGSGIISYDYGIKNFDIKVETTFSPKQSGSGDPSPENIHPISGHSGLTITRSGKNLLPFPYQDGGAGDVVEKDGARFAINADGSITISGTPTATTWFMLARMDLGDATIVPGGSNGTYALSQMVRYNHNNHNVSINLAAGTTYDITLYPQIELGTESTSYAPYTADTFAATFDETVYGGKIDWLTGKLTAEWAVTNLSHESAWSSLSTIGDFTRAILHESLTNAAEPEMTLSANGLCSHAKYITDWAGEFTHIYAFDTSVVATFPTALVGTTSDSISAWIVEQEVAGTPVQIAYKLASPIEIQLNAYQISSLQGLNNIYGDGDSHSVVFNASGGTSLSTAGGKVYGKLDVIKNNTNNASINIHRDINNTSYDLCNTILDDGTGIISYYINNSRVNYLQFSENAFYINKPLSVSSGGTGASSKSGARTNLGIDSGTSLPDPASYSEGDIFFLIV